MAFMTNDSTDRHVRSIGVAVQQRSLRSWQLKNQVWLMFLVSMILLGRVGSAEDKKTILETLTQEELATINELAAADRMYATGCLSAPRKTNSRKGGRYGWDNLRAEETFVVLRNPSDQLEDAGCIHIYQIVDEKNFLGAGGNVWVEGISTEGLADGRLLNVHGMPFMCVGSKTYSTAIGVSRTVMHIVRVNPDDSVEALRPIAESRGMRVWGEGTGSLVLAEFVRADSRELVIKLWEGKRKNILMKAVGDVDAKWIESEKGN
jgi:hypothetical protein